MITSNADAFTAGRDRGRFRAGMSLEGDEGRRRALDELCALVLAVMAPSTPRRKKMTASGLALLLLGVSVAMMTCGWVTFLLGFMLMPWVLAVLLFLYIVGAVAVAAKSVLSTLSGSGCCCSDPNDSSGWHRCPWIAGVDWDLLGSS